jgi:hypothetical protein
MKKKKSLRTLAKELQISPAYLSLILAGKRRPNEILAKKLCIMGLLHSKQARTPVGLGSKHSTAELHPHCDYLAIFAQQNQNTINYQKDADNPAND